jgi:hypothetical protein
MNDIESADEAIGCQIFGGLAILLLVVGLVIVGLVALWRHVRVVT